MAFLEVVVCLLHLCDFRPDNISHLITLFLTLKFMRLFFLVVMNIAPLRELSHPGPRATHVRAILVSGFGFNREQ